MESAYYTCIYMLLLVKLDLADQGDIYDSPFVSPSCTGLENDTGHTLPSSNMTLAAICGGYYYDSSTDICVEGCLYSKSQILIFSLMETGVADNRPSSFYLRKPPVKTSAFQHGMPKDVGRTDVHGQANQSDRLIQGCAFDLSMRRRKRSVKTSAFAYEGRMDAPGQGNQSGRLIQVGYPSVYWQNFFFGWPGFSIVVAILYGLRKIFRKFSVRKQHVDYGSFERQQLLEEVSALDVVVEIPLDNGQQDEDETILKTKYGDESNSVGPGLEWGSLLYETVPKTKYGDESNSVGSGLDWESIISN